MTLVPPCCRAEVRVPLWRVKEAEKWFECAQCGNPCDPVEKKVGSYEEAAKIADEMASEWCKEADEGHGENAFSGKSRYGYAAHCVAARLRVLAQGDPVEKKEEA